LTDPVAVSDDDAAEGVSDVVVAGGVCGPEDLI
jgi:hypothetical protein